MVRVIKKRTYHRHRSFNEFGAEVSLLATRAINRKATSFLHEYQHCSRLSVLLALLLTPGRPSLSPGPFLLSLLAFPSHTLPSSFCCLFLRYPSYPLPALCTPRALPPFPVSNNLNIAHTVSLKRLWNSPSHGLKVLVSLTVADESPSYRTLSVANTSHTWKSTPPKFQTILTNFLYVVI